MRILKVRLRNLTSLSGEHEIDFRDEPLASSGIFAITGPTGAGKSTILDAITLALYGRAARYENSQPTDMMSRHTGEAEAEVTFEVKQGIYRSVWQLRRSRGKKDGNLQNAKRYVYDIEGQVLAEKIREADRLIEDLSGLDYDRFLRSVLLAQGDFARFLKASDDERAALLESLTGTVIYSELGSLSYAEYARRERDLGEKTRHLETIELLEDDQRAALKEGVEALLKSEFEKGEEVDCVSQGVAKSLELVELIREGDQLKLLQASHTAKTKDAEGDLDRLRLHQLGSGLHPLLDQYEQASRSHESILKELKKTSAEVESAEIELRRNTGVALAIGENRRQDFLRQQEKIQASLDGEEKRKESIHSWLTDHRADAALEEMLPRIVGDLTEQQSLKKQQKEIRKSKLDEERIKEAVEQELSNVERAVSHSRSQKEKLEAGIGESSSHLVESLRRKREIIQELQHLTRLSDKETEKLASLTTRITVAKKELLLLEEQKAETSNKEFETKKRFEEKFAEVEREERRLLFETHRSHLVEGEECPLCGALEHPLADQIPDVEESELSNELSILERSLKQLQQEVIRIADESGRKQTSLDSLLQQSAELDAEMVELKERKTDLAASVQLTESVMDRLDEEFLSVSQQIERVTQSQNDLTSANHQLEKLEQSQVAYRRQLSDVQRQIDRDEGAIKLVEKRLGEIAKELGEKLAPFGGGLVDDSDLRESLENRHKTYLEKRNGLQASADRMNELSQEKASCERKREKIEEFLNRLDSDVERVEGSETRWPSLSAAESEIRELEKMVDRLVSRKDEQVRQERASKQALKDCLALLEEKVVESEFETVDQLREARLPLEEEKVLRVLEQSLRDEGQKLQVRIEHNSQSLEKQRQSDVVEGEELVKLQGVKRQLESEQKTIIEERVKIQEAVRLDDERRKERALREKDLEEEKTILRRWGTLRHLIGSADGQKFRKFAQGISLESLVRRANRHLARLTERYLLQRTSTEELAIEIVDLFQAGATRPMSSLSGGETFVASLALALGLSDIAGRNVQIDSLFIDEGFGSLDPDTLDIAIAALEQLQSSNKTVGVISHVGLLKERITTQIVVERRAGGNSFLRVLPAFN